MIYHYLAELVFLIHLLFIVFVIFGGLLVLWKPVLILLHLPMMSWGVLVNFMRWECPLTPLEVSFRHMAGEQGYSTGFLEYYFSPLIYPESVSMPLGIVLGSLLLIWNMIVYIYIIRKNRFSRRRNNR